MVGGGLLGELCSIGCRSPVLHLSLAVAAVRCTSDTLSRQLSWNVAPAAVPPAPSDLLGLVQHPACTVQQRKGVVPHRQGGVRGGQGGPSVRVQRHTGLPLKPQVRPPGQPQNGERRQVLPSFAVRRCLLLSHILCCFEGSCSARRVALMNPRASGAACSASVRACQGWGDNRALRMNAHSLFAFCFPLACRSARMRQAPGPRPQPPPARM